MTARTIPTPTINARRWMMALTMFALLVALSVGASGDLRSAFRSTALPAGNKMALDNVRDFAAAASPAGHSYAVDGGLLYSGRPLDWALVSMPQGVIANAVAVDDHNPNTVYVGAANELALYRTSDEGATWLRVPLSDEHVAAVTDITVDGENRLVYVGTDNAGVFRLRDVGSSLTSGGHFLVDEPVVEVAADSTGAGLAFFRTASNLYRSENGGLAWAPVKTLFSQPTAVVVANTKPPVVYVGTSEQGVLKSKDGVAWMTANDGLNVVPGTRVNVDALAVDPQRPEVLYVATSYVYGSTTLRQTPAGVAMSRGGAVWSPIVRSSENPVVALLPVSGEPGAVYALLNNSRTPMALGMAPAASHLAAPEAAGAGLMANAGTLVAWMVAALAAMWLAVLAAGEWRRAAGKASRGAVQAVRSNH